MSNSHEYGASAVRSPCFQPLTGDSGEVGGIKRHDDATLRGGQRQEILVLAAIEGTFVVDSPHIMAPRPQSSADAPT